LLLCLDCHEGVFLGGAIERELAFGNYDAVDGLVGQLVYEIDLFSFACVGSANGILHLLCHCGQACGYECR